MTPRIVALIPARAGSKRIPGKNTRDFFGHPLIAYTIQAAKDSGIFQDVVLCTDDATATGGTGSVFLREPVPDDQPDIVWVKQFLSFEAWPRYDAFAILRPTSPFRTAKTIRRAFEAFSPSSWDSIRAIEPVKQHPGKMWTIDTSVYGGRLEPIYDLALDGVPWHSCPTQILPQVYVQNVSLEMAWTRVVSEHGTISGTKIGPFLTEGYEGFDLNTEDDWREATRLVRDGLVALPTLAPQTPTALTE